MQMGTLTDCIPNNNPSSYESSPVFLLMRSALCSACMGEENWDTTTNRFPVHPHVFSPAHHPRYRAPSRAYRPLMKATVDSLDSCKTTDA